ncbi:SusD/RagB family nutrient-binding outer membrane lipoprotein [Arenibacter sp. GZD96]|uniref:SusD/RagB family nutrient-binding outer membrane lipoprotein n=1 Tax=Aurantibrevibacter litoralis TaxID=3106030 RepID=UPI002AFFA748|nr:SusD/RagB family nutrient-binding outer membrane lipoprotein [Arenibacter sp. GZD-96]MEA1784818.1 SusD/RagB family nutrient-binding outer membrane lipoprotein [Arenibacter sp. GZD-96]
MKKILITLSFSLMILGLFSACTDDFDGINTDPKNFTLDAVTSAEYPLFVRSALFTPHYTPWAQPGRDGRGPFQLGHSLFPDIYANYFSTTAPNFGSDQFELVDRWLNGAYLWFYGQAAPNIKVAEDQAETLGFTLENAMMKVWRVYFYHRITDLWGPIPYLNFGNLESTVPYDSQEVIYSDFFTSLDEAVTVLKANAGQTSFLGSNDIIYGGSADNWLKFANTLRLRLAMRIKYVDAAKSRVEAEKAVADGVMTDNSESAFIPTGNDFRNHYTTITQWGEFRMSADMESILKGYQDPRVSSYFSEADIPDPLDDPAGVTFNYEGMRNGQSIAQKQGTPFNDIASNMAEAFITADTPGPDWPVIRASEAFFLRAEGAVSGWNMGGTAADLYNQGIVASHIELGFSGTDLSGNDYVSSTNVPAALDASTPPVSTVPVAFDAGASAERQLEQIITQKWIALYPDSEEAYAERRRTGYPTLYDRLNSINPNIPVTEIPRRMPYVSSEYSTNGEAVQQAVSSLLGGPDNGTTKLWWDKKN